MSSKSNSIRFLADPQLFIMGIVSCFVFSFVVPITIHFILLTESNTAESDERSIMLIILMLALFYLITAFCVMPRWCVILTMVPEGIWIQPAFRRKAFISYETLPDIHIAQYRHIFVNLKFIVFTCLRLSSNELENINHVKSNSQLIKLRYTKKTAEKLQEILPPRQQRKFRAIVNKN